MKYDDASWHYNGDFPTDLPVEAGATHIGMFVAGCMLNGLTGSIHTDEFPDELESLRSRRLTPGQFVAVMHPQRIAPDTITFQLISHNI